MNDVLIHAEGLSKRYKLYAKPSARFAEWLTRAPKHEEFWALKDFSLDVKRGQCVGIIGANGAGKSTLLRILSGTLTPTTGHYHVDGNVLSLLELGTGFDANLTGRQNVLHTAELLGFEESFVRSKLPDIEAFADLGEFFERPIRMYSSGMQVRLGFSMFAAFDPTVLIVDEALSVGDVAFQRKCYRRIEQIVEDDTKAVLFVSHDLSTIQKLCDQVVWMDRGRIRAVGEPKPVVEAYMKFMFGVGEAPDIAPVVGVPIDQQQQAEGVPTVGLLPRSPAAVSYPREGVELLGVWLENDAGELVSSVNLDQPFTICYGLRFHQAVEKPVFGVRVATVRGELLVATNTVMMDRSTGSYQPGQLEIVRWPIKPGLTVAEYFISCGVSTVAEPYQFLMREVDAFQFSVVGQWKSSALASLVENPVLKHS
jgi:ABC-type polysaccharide/polyol phosphate transport system ATPase subunit